MGGFDEHVRAGAIVAIVAAALTGIYAIKKGYTLRTIAILIGGVFTVLLIGSVIPDIDIHSSIPRRYLGKILIGTAVVGALFVSVQNPWIPRMVGLKLVTALGLTELPVSVVGSSVLVVGLAAVAKGAGHSLDELLTHRGITHTVGFAVFFGGIALLLSRRSLSLEIKHAMIIGAAGVVGVLVHTHWVDR